MKNAITHVGLDAPKKDIYVAMLVSHERVPVTWQEWPSEYSSGAHARRGRITKAGQWLRPVADGAQQRLCRRFRRLVIARNHCPV